MYTESFQISHLIECLKSYFITGLQSMWIILSFVYGMAALISVWYMLKRVAGFRLHLPKLLCIMLLLLLLFMTSVFVIFETFLSLYILANSIIC